jgi:hypothetical protein
MGLYADDHERLGMLAAQAWRAARLVVDTGIHALSWDRDRAVATLLEATGDARSSAEIEVDRYICWPGQALSYMVGQLEIERWRSTLARREGDGFSPQAFHDRLLSLGSLPLESLQRRRRPGGGAPRGPPARPRGGAPPPPGGGGAPPPPATGCGVEPEEVEELEELGFRATAVVPESRAEHVPEALRAAFEQAGWELPARGPRRRPRNARPPTRRASAAESTHRSPRRRGRWSARTDARSRASSLTPRREPAAHSLNTSRVRAATRSLAKSPSANRS